jgi:hypothetical protein
MRPFVIRGRLHFNLKFMHFLKLNGHTSKTSGQRHSSSLDVTCSQKTGRNHFLIIADDHEPCLLTICRALGKKTDFAREIQEVLLVPDHPGRSVHIFQSQLQNSALVGTGRRARLSSTTFGTS